MSKQTKPHFYHIVYDKDLKSTVAIEFKDKDSWDEYVKTNGIDIKEDQTAVVYAEDNDYQDTLFHINRAMLLCSHPDCCNMGYEEAWRGDYGAPPKEVYYKGSVGNSYSIYFKHFSLCPTMKDANVSAKNVILKLWYKRNADYSMKYRRQFVTDVIEDLSNVSLDRYRIVRSEYLSTKGFEKIGKVRKYDLPHYAKVGAQRIAEKENIHSVMSMDRIGYVFNMGDLWFSLKNNNSITLDMPSRAVIQFATKGTDDMSFLRHNKELYGYVITDNYLIIDCEYRNESYICEIWKD